jgi:hypothetical protein
MITGPALAGFESEFDGFDLPLPPPPQPATATVSARLARPARRGNLRWVMSGVPLIVPLPGRG